MSAATPASPTVRGSSASTNARRFLKRNAWLLALLVLLAVMLVFTKFIQPDYGPRAFVILVVAALPFAFATAGQTMAIIAGGIDLSIAAMMALIICSAFWGDAQRTGVLSTSARVMRFSSISSAVIVLTELTQATISIP